MLEGNIKEIRVYYKDSYKYKDKGEIARFVSDEDDDLASSTSVIITKIAAMKIRATIGGSSKQDKGKTLPFFSIYIETIWLESYDK